MEKKVTAIFIAAVAVLVGIITFFTSINIVREGTVGVVRRLGVVTDTITPGGLNVHFSWIHDVEIFDVRIREADISFVANTRDAQIINGHVAIHYRINPANLTLIVQEFGSLNALETRLHAMLTQEVQNVFATKQAMELVENRAELAPEIHARLQRLVQHQFHVFIENVAMESMTFSTAFNQAVEQRAIADQALRQSELDAARDMVYAQRNLDIARLEAEAVIVAAQASADSVVIAATAEAEAVTIMLAAWTDAAPDIREIQIRQQALEVWNGVLPQIIGGDFDFILDNFVSR